VKNLQLALRSLFKTPLVTSVAVLSLALGIGANAAIFSIFEHVILESLPVHEPGQLVNLLGPGPKSGSQSTNNAGGMDSVFSFPMYRDLAAADTALLGVAGHCAFGANLSHQGETVSSQGMLVTGTYFEVLGLRPALGRLFDAEDDRTIGAHPVVVLSHSYWKNRFASSPTVLGDTLIINGQTLTIVGVTPQGFNGTTLGNNPKVFVPTTMRGQMIPGWEGLENRQSYWIYLFGRLPTGTSVEQATASINGPYQGIIQEVELQIQGTSSESYLQHFAEKKIVLESGNRGQSSFQEGAKTPLLLLFGVTAFVLLIACANIANLLLVRATHRAGEIAIRMSIGARRYQVVRQLLTESFLLAAMGAIVGLVVAKGTLFLLLILLPPDSALDLAVRLSSSVWIFLALMVVVTGLAGLFPALHSTREDLIAMIKNQGGKASASRGANRFRAAMVTLQIALSMALLTSAGLFTKSLMNVSKVDLGLEVAQIATFGLSPELNGYTPADSQAFFQRVEDAVRGIPGVTGVAGSRVPLISGSNWGSNVTVQGFEADPDTNTHSNFNQVGPGFFRTLGIPLIAGEDFEDRHAAGTPQVAVVNETFARKFGLGRDAVGKRMEVGASGELDIEIIGLAKDAKYSEVKREIPPIFFLPYRQEEDLGALNFYVRTGPPPETILPHLREAVAALDPNLPVENLRTMEMQVDDNVFEDRALTTLSAAFALLATLLAAVGLYGIMSYSVARRTREIGLRMALGADARRVRGLILRQVGSLTVFGAVLGILGAFAIGRAARSLLFELEGHDPTVFILSILALSAIVLAAGLIPARRASSIDPMTALGEE